MKRLQEWICVVSLAAATLAAEFSELQEKATEKRREPNNVQCFKNADCISDCCISSNGWVGVCVGRPSVGQICGLFTKSMAGAATSGGGGYNNEAWNSWLYSGMLSTMLGTNNGIGMAGQASAASLARGNMQQMGLAGGKVLGVQTNPNHYQTVGGGHYPADPRIQAYQSGGGYGGPMDGGNDYYGRGKRRKRRAANKS